MSTFYVLDKIYAGNTKRYAGGQWVNNTGSRCQGCGIWIPETEPDEIKSALNHLGRDGFVEYLWNSHGLPIFREDLVEVWQQAGLTGFRCKPVRVVGWDDRPKRPLPMGIPTYYRLVLASYVRLREPRPGTSACSCCGFVRYSFPKTSARLESGIAIDDNTWDGADFMGLYGYEFVFCARRAAQVTLEAGYNRHIAFVRQEDWDRWEEFRVDTWKPKDYDQYIESFLIRDPTRL